MTDHSPKELAEVLKKIQLFRGLSPTQIRLILSQCVSKSVQAGDHICKSGKPSDKMYILITGKLAIVTEENVRVAIIDPVTTVGEMGAITGQPRSASVEAVRPCRILVIQKPKLDTILRGQRELRSRIYENVIHMLSDKLVRDNVRMRDFLSAKTRFQEDSTQKEQRFDIALDLLAEKGMSAEEAKAEIDTRASQLPKRILVVDDDPVSRALLVKALSAYSVLEAENGLDAIKQIGKGTPDLVITDIQMPEMDGIGRLKQLRKKKPKLPVLAVTGFMGEEELAENDFNGHLFKPVSVQDLKELVQKTLTASSE